MTLTSLDSADTPTDPASRGVQVRNLTVTTKSGVPIIDDISFDVRPGHVLGLVGESGSGKSTAGVALLGLARRGLAIAAGSVVVDGVNLLAMSKKKLRNARGHLVAYVPQDPASALNPALRVRRQLLEVLTVHPGVLHEGESPDDRVRTTLESVGLPDVERILHSYPHQLSGGQQQRIGIAMAVLSRPRLIILDEPTTGLDVTTQKRVLAAIKRLTAELAVSSVYVSHDLAVVGQVAENTAVMYAGRLVEYGPTSTLFAAAAHHYTAGLLRAAPSARRSEVLIGISGRPPRPGSWPAGCSFADRCSESTAACRESLPDLGCVDGEDRAHLVRCIHPIRAASDSLAKPAVPPVPGRQGRALQVRSLTAHYGHVEVLRDISFRVEPGRCLAIVGESGSGKTTLARCLVSLHTSWDGQLQYGDTDLPRQPKARSRQDRQKIQYVFQNPYASLNPRMTVGENLEEPLRYFTDMGAAARRKAVADILGPVGLSPDFAGRMPDQLSGGERQRVAVGRALIVDPDLLVCDEVTSALDVSVQALLVEQLRQLQRDRGLSMVFITHNLAVVRSIAQDVIVLAHGRIVEAGPVDEVLDNPQDDYTWRLLTDLPHIDAPAVTTERGSADG